MHGHGADPGRGLAILIALRHREVDPYSAVALNDAFSFYGRLVFLLTGLILLALAHDQVDDDRAAEFFGSLLMIDAGAMLVAAANELVFLFVGLELVSIPTYLLLYLSRRQREHAGGGHQVFLPEHLLVGPAALRPGVPLRADRREQPEGPGLPGRARPERARSRNWP